MVDVHVAQLRRRAAGRPEQLAHQITQQRMQWGNVPLAVTDREQSLADGIARLDPKRAKEGAVRVRHAEVRREHEQRFSNRVDDVDQQFFSGTSAVRNPDSGPRGGRLDVGHRADYRIAAVLHNHTFVLDAGWSVSGSDTDVTAPPRCAEIPQMVTLAPGQRYVLTMRC